ncbi:acyl carrier protein [Streptomyces sp. NPDC053048]|uniref:acyl carrier protein n=1 Tax=Streptomyces sp. NPDC053048 TaxID=3365694 RepID=UPI0037D12AE2
MLLWEIGNRRIPFHRMRDAMQMDAEVQAVAKKIVAEILEIDPGILESTDRFKEDHGADSMRAIEILAALEERFEVTVAQHDIARMVDLDGVYTALANAVDSQ